MTPVIGTQNPYRLGGPNERSAQYGEVGGGKELLGLNRDERQAYVFARESKRYPRNLAYFHVREDLVVHVEVAARLGPLQPLGSDPQAVEVWGCAEHLGKSGALCFRQCHKEDRSN